MTNKKISLLKMLSVIIATLTLASVMPHFSMTTKAAESNDRIIVSMGDSYSSGEGIEDFYDFDKPLNKRIESQDWLSHRSKNSWGGMLKLSGLNGTMSDHHNTNWFFVAMSGAVTNNILDNEPLPETITDDYIKQKNYRFKYYKQVKSYDTTRSGVQIPNEIIEGNVPISPQLSIFESNKLKGKNIDYVTLTLGGNDAGFTSFLQEVFLGSSYLNPNKVYDKFQRTLEDIPTIKDNLIKSYKAIADKTDCQPYIIVAGYPRLLDENGKGFLVSKYEAEVTNSAVSYFNNVIKNAVGECSKETINNKNIKIKYVSVEEKFQNHGAYSKQPWINGLITDIQDQDIAVRDIKHKVFISSYSMHPNLQGAKAYAECVQNEIDKIEGVESSTNTPRPKPTEKPTDKAVEIPTHKPTETKEYTAVELASKSLDEIIEIMGGDYTSEHVQLSNAFSSSGAPYIYNYDVLPGFAFETYDNYYRGISIMDGAKLNDKISSDMTYNQIADEIGDMEGMLVAQEGNIACSKTVDGYNVAFCFIENDYIRNNKDNSGKISSDVLRGGNPSLQSIGLIMNTEPESEEQPVNNSFGMSDEEIKSMLTSDRWILQEVYVDGERYQGNYYGSIISQTGAYIDFNNDGSFKCCLGFVGCNGTYSVNNGSVNITITQNIVDAKTIDTEETKELGWRSEDNTILFDYSAFDSGENVTNAFRQI